MIPYPFLTMVRLGPEVLPSVPALGSRATSAKHLQPLQAANISIAPRIPEARPRTQAPSHL